MGGLLHDQGCMSCGGGHMQGAADHDRLSSNTYRRVNLGLAAWAGANLTLLAKGAASHVVTWCSGYAADTNSSHSEAGMSSALHRMSLTASHLTSQRAS